MHAMDGWRFDPGFVLERLALGLDLFGPYADWLWFIPAFWAASLVSLWLYTSWQQRESDRAYLDYASRNLPILRRLARHRAQEVALSKLNTRR